MSYSLEMIFKNTNWAIGTHALALTRLQQKAATGQDINRTSDNPNRSSHILGFQTDSRMKEVYIKTMKEASSTLDLSSSVVQSIISELGRARASMASTMSGVASEQMRRTLAVDLNNALEQLVSFANTDRLGQHLFAGASSGDDAYRVVRNDIGEIVQVIYQGSPSDQKIEIIQGMEISAMLVGDQLFRDDTPESPAFYGTTGTAAGTGTSSIRGDVVLTVTGTAGNYQLSIDGGLNTVAVNGTENNVALVHSQTGQVLYVDATGITQTGTDVVRVPGTFDIFNILIHARDLLKNEEGLEEEQINQLLNNTIVSMQGVEEKLSRAFPVIGGRMQTLTNLQQSLEDMKTNTDGEISRLRDADITQVAIDLARHEMLYEMSLTAASKIFSLSLLDFLE